MPCMCGDLYCYSCGPAQGAWQCDMCGAWDDTCVDKERCLQEEDAYWDALAKDLNDEAALANEYWESL